MVEAALISDSPVTTWETSPLAVQWTSGKRGERPGTVMFWARRLYFPPYQTAASGANMLMMTTLGEIGAARLRTWSRTSTGFPADNGTRPVAASSRMLPKLEERMVTARRSSSSENFTRNTPGVFSLREHASRWAQTDAGTPASSEGGPCF